MLNRAVLDFGYHGADQRMRAEAAGHEIGRDHERQEATVGFPTERGAHHSVCVEARQDRAADLGVGGKVVRAAFDFAGSGTKAEHAQYGAAVRGAGAQGVPGVRGDFPVHLALAG